MTPAERYLALELNVNTLYWRGDSPVLCVVEDVEYVAVDSKPFAIVSVRLSHSGRNPVDLLWSEEEEEFFPAGGSARAARSSGAR